MLAKTCLSCGYRGAALQGSGRGSGRNASRALRCPGCGTDLYARPPRSYAELEGFVPSDESIDERVSQYRVDRPRLRRARTFVVRALVMAAIITPPLVVVATAGALAAIWMLRG